MEQTLAQVWALLPSSEDFVQSRLRVPDVLDFIRDWELPTRVDGGERVFIKPKVDILTVEQQRKLIRAYMCGYPERDGTHVPGYAEAILNLDRDECRL
jgi:hypothetical protein